jgi:hypothetical protein
MCMACEMEAMWFAAMEARARAVAAEGTPQPAALLPPLEKEGVGEGIAGGKGGADGESVGPLPNLPPRGGGGSRPFACEETQAE